MTNFAISQAFAAEHASEGQAHLEVLPQLQCPACREGLFVSSSRLEWACQACGFLLVQADGVFRAMTPGRESHFCRFIREYEWVREKEGRGCASADYYLQLPYEDLTGRNSWQWAIRGRTFRYMERHVLSQIERAFPHGCDILDIGAGNCWLSFRLALRGQRPVAVDLLDNDADGLGAARHYLGHLRQPFARFQAEMDRLPFSAGQFDIAIFNASFHYSVNYEQTLRETLRCLRRPGHVIIADSPFYWRDQSGEIMRLEKHAAFQKQFGFRSDSIPSREFLTRDILDDLSTKLGLEWQVLRPWYGLGWASRPMKARLFRRREPSKFYLIWAHVKG